MIEDDRITDVGTAADVAGRTDESGATVIDATDKAVMPGLVDLHYHTAARQGLERPPAAVGVPRHVLVSDHPRARTRRRRTGPRSRATASRSSAASPRSTTCTGSSAGWRKAAEEIGIRAVLSNDVADDEHDLDTLEDNKLAYEQSNGAANGRIEVYIGIEWLPLASEGLLKDARALADDLDTGIHIHLNESLTEVENSKQRFGRRPTEVAYDCGILFDRLHRGALRLALRHRDRADARDRHADLAQPVVEREARQRHRAGARDAGRRPQRGARSRRGRVQQQPRHVRGDEVRVVDAPREPGGPEPAAGAGRRPDGHAQRLGGAASRDR